MATKRPVLCYPRRRRAAAECQPVHPCVAWPLLRAAYAAQLGVSADRIFFGGEVGAGAPCGIRHLSGPSVQICLASVLFATLINEDRYYEDVTDWSAITVNSSNCSATGPSGSSASTSLSADPQVVVGCFGGRRTPKTGRKLLAD